MIGSSENRISYNGNGIATEFAYNFIILEKSDIKVLHVAADGTEELLTTDYYVDMEKSVVLYPGYAPGAEIPEQNRPPILPVGERLVLYREVPITQESALDKHWPFNVIENGLDKLTIICQQIWDRLQRSFYVSESTSTNFDPKVPIEAGKTFRVKDDGTGFEVTEDPGKVIDGATALLKQTTEQAVSANEAATNAQNAANKAEEHSNSAKQAELHLTNIYQDVLYKTSSVVSPDTFNGTDTEKLQAAIYSLEETGGTILINREYNIENNLHIKHNSSDRHFIHIIGINKGVGINMNSYSFVGDTISVGACGGIYFENLVMQGNGTLIDNTNLVRMYFDKCTIYNFNYVVNSAPSHYIQSYYFTNCYIRKINECIMLASDVVAYDIVFMKNIIEWCKNFLIIDYSNKVTVLSNCIEGFTDIPIILGTTQKGVLISNNYFEGNGDGLNIKITGAGNRNITIANNNFIETRDCNVIKLSDYSVENLGTIVIKENHVYRNNGAKLLEITEGVVYNDVLVINNDAVYADNITEDNLLVIDADRINDNFRNKFLKNITYFIKASYAGIGIGSKELYIPINLPKKLRTSSTITINSVQVVNIGTFLPSDTTFTVSTVVEHGFVLECKKEEALFTAGRSYICTVSFNVKG